MLCPIIGLFPEHPLLPDVYYSKQERIILNNSFCNAVFLLIIIHIIVTQTHFIGNLNRQAFPLFNL